MGGLPAPSGLFAASALVFTQRDLGEGTPFDIADPGGNPFGSAAFRPVEGIAATFGTGERIRDVVGVDGRAVLTTHRAVRAATTTGLFDGFGRVFGRLDRTGPLFSPELVLVLGQGRMATAALDRPFFDTLRLADPAGQILATVTHETLARRDVRLGAQDRYRLQLIRPVDPLTRLGLVAFVLGLDDERDLARHQMHRR